MTAMYGEFSKVYDRLMRDVDYDGWASYICALLNENGFPSGGTVYECCCGTGQITRRLAEKDMNVIASDLSDDMLMIARERCRTLGKSVRIVHQDMRSICVHKPVDAVIACCDGVNYLTGGSDLGAFLKSSYVSLRNGGILLFDISSAYKYACILGMNTFGEDEEDLCYLWRNMYDEKTALAELSLTFFIKREDGTFTRFRETQLHRSYTVPEIIGTARSAGFIAVGAYRFGTLSPAEEKDERIQFVLRKDG